MNSLDFSKLPDEKLIRKSQRGDKLAFEALMSRHESKLRPILYKSGVHNKENIDEILQIAYVKCWTKIKTFKFKSAFGTWLYRVVKNSSFDFFRQEQRRKEREIPYEDFFSEEGKNPLDFLQGSGILFSSEENPSFYLEGKEEIESLKKKLRKIKKQLSPAHAQVIELVLEQEMTYKDAAKQIKCPVGTVMSRLFIARKRARKLIKQK